MKVLVEKKQKEKTTAHQSTFQLKTFCEINSDKSATKDNNTNTR